MLIFLFCCFSRQSTWLGSDCNFSLTSGEWCLECRFSFRSLCSAASGFSHTCATWESVWGVGCGLYCNLAFKAFAVSLRVSPRHVHLNCEPGNYVDLRTQGIRRFASPALFLPEIAPSLWLVGTTLFGSFGQNDRMCLRMFGYQCQAALRVHPQCRAGREIRIIKTKTGNSLLYDVFRFRLPQSTCFCFLSECSGSCFFIWPRVFSVCQ